MRLISLTSNISTFRPIYFKRSGLTLIIGRQKNPKKPDSGKTYNGVGKSLVIGLIHFCLGSSVNKKLQEAIPDWEFTLTFEINGTQFVASRNTSTQKEIELSGEGLTLVKFRDRLENAVFQLPPNIKGVTFRSLLPRFIRPRKESYISFDSVRDQEKEYDR